MAQPVVPSFASRILGSLYGLGLGDAYAAPTEFMGVAEICERWPPSGPTEPPRPATVTDDTQMAIAVGMALRDAGKGLCEPLPVTTSLAKRLREWLHDPTTPARAPGSTCIRACRGLDRGEHWLDATVLQSKGCGANMRVTPVGLIAPEVLSASNRAGLAQLQAAMTHGHPTGLAAADLTAETCALLLAGAPPTELPAALRSYAESQRHVYHTDWLGDLWVRAGDASAEAFIARGWNEQLGILDRLEAALAAGDDGGDPCRHTGEGWIAEEALGTALLCFLWHADDAPAVLKRAAVTKGDSDSLGALAGAFAGAYLGADAWPMDWVERLEYRSDLASLGAWLESLTPAPGAVARTSESHPLQVGWLGPAAPHMGLTFAPGKRQQRPQTGRLGAWHRDLGTDLDALANAGVTLLVSLVEEHELHELHIADLVIEANTRGIDVLRFPIRDYHTPEPAALSPVIDRVVAELASGAKVVAHCKGGLGRAGTLGGCVLKRLGVPDASVFESLKAARGPGCPETSDQRAFIRAFE